jgi:ketosteroid isomerase-like protein
MKSMISQGSGVPTITAQHHANHETKSKFVDALFANDWEAMKPLVHPTLFELREPAALPYGGIYKGLDGFKRCWELIPQSSHRADHLDTLHSYFAEDPDRIIVELDFKGTRTDTGEKIESRVLEQFEFVDGLISAIVLYWFDIPDFKERAAAA